MRYIDVKRIVQPNNNFNLYRGCTHGCIYCDSRSLCYEVGDFENIAVKKDALELMESELSRKRKKAILTTGSMSDPYVHIESGLKITEGALKLIEKYGFGVSVLTKSAMILRDIEIYKNINRRFKAIVSLTLTTTDDLLASVIEPHVSLPSERLEVLRKFSDQGITTGVWMSPILPFLEDNEKNIKAIVDKAKAAGVTYILCFGLGTTMREGSREYFYKNLDLHFPGLKEQYIKTYKNSYICPSPVADKLYKVFSAMCEELGIIYRQEEISQLFKSNNEQLSLF